MKQNKMNRSVNCYDPHEQHSSFAVATTKTDVQESAGPNVVVQEHPLKQGRKCCGCCCDFRRAVITCNIILIVFGMIGVIILAVSGPLLYTGTTDDETVENFMKKYVISLIVVEVIGWFFNGMAIFGALKYNVWMVGAAVAWLLVEYVIGIVIAVMMCSEWKDQDDYYDDDDDYDYYYYYDDYECTINGPGLIFSFGVILFWIYPHIGLIKEVTDGIMSEETYEREEFSCCCAPTTTS